MSSDMSIWPGNKRDWLSVAFVAPLPVWLPLAWLFLIGTQGSRSPGHTVEITVAVVTTLLLLLAIFGAWKIRRSAK